VSEGSEAGQCAQPVVWHLLTISQVEAGEGSEAGQYICTTRCLTLAYTVSS
jgi:hypothetical protein